MATTASDQLYPFSTEDGKSIPLEVIRPLGVFVLPVTNSGHSLTLDSTFELISVYSTVQAIWTFSGSTIAEEAIIEDALFLPPHVMMTAILPKDATHFIKSLDGNGHVYIQGIQKWAGLGLNRQITRR